MESAVMLFGFCSLAVDLERADLLGFRLWDGEFGRRAAAGLAG